MTDLFSPLNGSVKLYTCVESWFRSCVVQDKYLLTRSLGSKSILQIFLYVDSDSVCLFFFLGQCSDSAPEWIELKRTMLSNLISMIVIHFFAIIPNYPLLKDPQHQSCPNDISQVLSSTALLGGLRGIKKELTTRKLALALSHINRRM